MEQLKLVNFVFDSIVTVCDLCQKVCNKMSELSASFKTFQNFISRNYVPSSNIVNIKTSVTEKLYTGGKKHQKYVKKVTMSFRRVMVGGS